MFLELASSPVSKNTRVTHTQYEAGEFMNSRPIWAMWSLRSPSWLPSYYKANLDYKVRLVSKKKKRKERKKRRKKRKKSKPNAVSV